MTDGATVIESPSGSSISHSLSSVSSGSPSHQPHTSSTSDRKQRPPLRKQLTEPWSAASRGTHSNSHSIKKIPEIREEVKEESCDLGLGCGLKPGGLPPVPDSPIHNQVKNEQPKSPTSSSADALKSPSSTEDTDQLFNHYYVCDRHAPKKKKWYQKSKSPHDGQSLPSSRKFSVNRQRTKSKSLSISSLDDPEHEESDISVMCPAFPDAALHDSDDEFAEPESESFPAFADVPMGTSIRQQKMLFRHDANEILNRSPLGFGAAQDNKSAGNLIIFLAKLTLLMGSHH